MKLRGRFRPKADICQLRYSGVYLGASTRMGNVRRLVKITAISLGVLVLVVSVWAIYTYTFYVHYHGPVESVSFQSGDDVTMKGLFIKPDATGIHPAVILLHGSGPLTADHPAVRIYANAFLRSGISVLVYDKRGVGSSGGTFFHSGYSDFIEDGISAVRYLESRSDVDADAIGLLGSSEGGWFSPEIAVTTGSVAFIVNRAGPPVPWIDTNLWEIRHDLIDSGVSGELLTDAVRLRWLIWRFLVKLDANKSLGDSEEWRHIDNELVAFYRKYGQDESWLKQRRRFGQRLADNVTSYKLYGVAISYDPQPYIEQLNIPMLYIFAEHDKNVPTALSVEYLRSLQGQPGSNIEFDVIAGVDHSMLSPAALFSAGVDPGFLSVVGPWAAAKVSAE